jgi:hypothetical protein
VPACAKSLAQRDTEVAGHLIHFAATSKISEPHGRSPYAE